MAETSGKELLRYVKCNVAIEVRVPLADRAAPERFLADLAEVYTRHGVGAEVGTFSGSESQGIQTLMIKFPYGIAD